MKTRRSSTEIAIVDLRTLPRGSSGREVCRCRDMASARARLAQLTRALAAVPGASPEAIQACRLTLRPVLPPLRRRGD